MRVCICVCEVWGFVLAGMLRRSGNAREANDKGNDQATADEKLLG